MSGYSVTFALKTNMNKLLGTANGGSGSDCTNVSGGSDGSANSLATTMMDRCFIIEKEYMEPENAAFAGRLGGFL